ncbi:DUF4157 domain-containing protein [Vitiosangium sp. GDMCC 1.1324]|uniref:eCIS core domain-containing protein n=1 Tax=Vitiosangium sp. (strain GDMCC 1.1324) TaxID=2138576 RepID=UPI000D3966A1|nr:DUF4157 domain-containing protein [Vitiosangium sp. GDMCC 1.1324]PTL76673.1 hypothetical protein DAT35_47940 [Vitiosangium sp. GDMCC 1.1324]
MSRHVPVQRKTAAPATVTTPSTATAPQAAQPATTSFANLDRAADLGHRLEQTPTYATPPAAGRTGQPLPEPLRAKMETAFGHDFAQVRVHENGNAAALGATAYTRGHDLHFAPGRYQPETQSGQALIGHELTHVVQQRAGHVAIPQGKGAPINADPGLEAEADRQGARAAQGLEATVRGVGSGVQRKAVTGGGGVIQCQGKSDDQAKEAAAEFVKSQAKNHHKLDSGTKGKHLSNKKREQYAASSQKEAEAHQQWLQELRARREAADAAPAAAAAAAPAAAAAKKPAKKKK